ncbi:hypothetical protein PF007_g18429 [Phytophthora fragariae]|uniref:Ty3 transposon capsid-like protein domain-containing protein n=1 Tax=Phytophthora fragariae TaxID=53985 RepID=A0A6A3RFS2_9STRA|nr:hypothetical protein PF007_g18429 [Phytophthora fragariae]
MPTIAQLQAEIDRLNQAMAGRTRVPTNLPKFTGKRGEDVREWLFQIENACRINGIPIEDASARLPGIAGSAMEKPASGWFLHWSSTTRSEEHTWGIFREHVLQHFEASNYQSVLREKLQRLKQTADIETYNGEYSALIFRVEGMSVLDQVLNYANGLKPRTSSYVKLENPETLSAAMDLAIKYEDTHFVDDSRPLFSVTGEVSVGDKCLATRNMLLDCGATTIYVSKRWVEEHRLQTTKFNDKSIRVKVGDNQIVEAELEVLPMEILVSGLHDVYKCVAVVYAIPDEFDCILGIPFFEDIQPQVDWRSRRIEGTITKTLHWKRAEETCEPIEEGGPVIASGLRRSVEAKGLSAKRHDSRRGAALETDVKLTVEAVGNTVQKKSPSVVRGRHDDAQAGKGSAGEDVVATSERESTVSEADGSSSTKGKHNIVEKVFTMGVVDESGVQTKYITRKKLRKFLRIKTKTADEPDFMLVLSNETIKQVACSLQRRDQPDNVGSAKAQRYLETDWETFRDNPAFNLLEEYKDNVFRPRTTRRVTRET